MKDVRMRLKRIKSIILAGLIIIAFVVSAVNIYYQFMYAKDLQISGVVVDIKWKTNNHQLPKFIIMNEYGKKIAISQFTIALNPSTIKVGDRIVKKEGSDFCMINGKKVLFSRS